MKVFLSSCWQCSSVKLLKHTEGIQPQQLPISDYCRHLIWFTTNRSKLDLHRDKNVLCPFALLAFFASCMV